MRQKFGLNSDSSSNRAYEKFSYGELYSFEIQVTFCSSTAQAFVFESVQFFSCRISHIQLYVSNNQAISASRRNIFRRLNGSKHGGDLRRPNGLYICILQHVQGSSKCNNFFDVLKRPAVCCWILSTCRFRHSTSR